MAVVREYADTGALADAIIGTLGVAVGNEARARLEANLDFLSGQISDTQTSAGGSTTLAEGSAGAANASVEISAGLVAGIEGEVELPRGLAATGSTGVFFDLLESDFANGAVFFEGSARGGVGLAVPGLDATPFDVGAMFEV